MFDDVAKELAEQTLRELARPPEMDKQNSRNWVDPKGYCYLAVWQNAALLRVLTRLFTSTLPTFRTLNQTLNEPLNGTLKGSFKGEIKGDLKGNVKSEHRLVAQMDDCARSTKRNIEEGFKRPTTSEYLTFLGYSQASLEELKGDVYDAKTDGYLISVKGSSLKGIGIDLTVFKGPSRFKGQTYGEPTEPGHPYYQALKKLEALPLSDPACRQAGLKQTLTYEIFIELINKTDYLLRQLVVSLENKLNADHKGYQIDKIRIRRKLA